MFCSSRFHFVPNNAIAGQSYDIVYLFAKLQLAPTDVDRLYTYFMSTANDDVIELMELFQSMKIQPCSPLLSSLCAIYDPYSYIGTNQATFKTWFLMMWDFLTLEEENWIIFLISMFDLKGHGTFRKVELVFLFKCLWGEKQYNYSRFIGNHIDRADEENNEVSLSSLMTVIKESPVILVPLFEARDVICNATIKQSFWAKLAKNRKRLFGTKSIFEILPDETNVLASKLHFVESLGKIIAMPLRIQSRLIRLRVRVEDSRRSRPPNRVREVMEEELQRQYNEKKDRIKSKQKSSAAAYAKLFQTKKSNRVVPLN